MKLDRLAGLIFLICILFSFSPVFASDNASGDGQHGQSTVEQNSHGAEAADDHHDSDHSGGSHGHVNLGTELPLYCCPSPCCR
jgi:hypothetical protein